MMQELGDSCHLETVRVGEEAAGQLGEARSTSRRHTRSWSKQQRQQHWCHGGRYTL